MKKFTKILILAVALITMIGSFAPRAFAVAVTPLDVQFVPDPLFVKPNFLPLDETYGTATVSNNSGATQTILTEANHVLDNDHFGNLLKLKIVGASGTLFDNTLAYFFTTAGEYSLGTIETGETKTFTYTVTFINSNDNSYQGKTLGFDVCIGFQGGNATDCGNTAIGNENGSGSNGGSSSGSTVLVIFNVQALNITNVNASGSATITWDTNKLATSQVVYGPTPPSYTLNLTPPNFGYPLFVAENPTKVINHSMLLTGLIPGTTYKYRVISRASPATVSPEFQFTVPLPTQVDNGLVLGASTENGTGGGQGSVLGANTENVPTDDGEVAGESINNLAGAVGGVVTGIWSSCYLLALLILILMYLVWRLWLRRRYKKLGIPEEEIENRFYLFFSLASLLTILVLLILGKYCPLAIFIIVFIISVCGYIYRKLRVR